MMYKLLSRQNNIIARSYDKDLVHIKDIIVKTCRIRERLPRCHPRRKMVFERSRLMVKIKKYLSFHAQFLPVKKNGIHC